jgi:hypothetical protein
MSRATFHMRRQVPLVVGNGLVFAQIIELTEYSWHGEVVSGTVSAIWEFNAGYSRKPVEVPAEGHPPAFGTVEVVLNLRYIDSWTVLESNSSSKELPAEVSHGEGG